MGLGAEYRTKVKWAIGLLLVALAVGVYDFGSGSKPASPVQADSEQKKAAASGIAKSTLDPAWRADLFEASPQLAYRDSSRNIFALKEEKQINPSGDNTDHAENQADRRQSLPAEEPPFPIDLKFFGYFRQSGEPRKICVSQGETVFLAQEGSLVGLRYKILEIKNTAVLVQDVLSNRQQTIAFTQ
jgi:hypothetical protein